MNFEKEEITKKIYFLCLLFLLATQMWLYETYSQNKRRVFALEQLEKSFLKELPDTLNFPNNLIDLESGKTIELDTLITKKIKILNFLNPGCFKCIEILPNWENFVDQYIENDSLGFLFIASGTSRKYLYYMIKRRMKFKYSVLYDSLNIMKALNDSLTVPSTIMVGINNDVVLAGSPILHPDLKSSYVEKINLLIQNNNRN